MTTILTTDYVRPSTAAKITTLARAFVYKLPPDDVRRFVVCRQLFLHRGDLEKYEPRDSVTRRKKMARLARKGLAKPTRPEESGVRIDPSLYVTVGTAAGIAGCSRSLIGDDCRRGRLPAVRIDGQWLVLRSAAEHRSVATCGRPRIHPLPAVRG